MMILKKELVCKARKSDLGTRFGRTSISYATTKDRPSSPQNLSNASNGYKKAKRNVDADSAHFPF